MKIVFWGTPQYAADNLKNIVNAGYKVIGVVTQPDRKRSRGKKLSPSPVKLTAINFAIPVYSTESISKDKSIKNLLIKLKADIYIVVAFGQILPKEILNQPELGSWNSHASLLPKWRGAAPIQWSIINGDSETGVCIMAMEEGLDTGPVIEKQSTEIRDTDNLEILTNRLSNISSNLLLKSLNKIINTKGLDKVKRLQYLNAIEQKKLNGNPSYARQIKKDDYLINWYETSKNILNRVNGLYPNAYTLHNGKRIKILKVSIFENSEKSITKKTPGKIIMVHKKNGLAIMTNDKPILIKYGQLEGKNKTDGYTLSTQANLAINNIVGS